MRTKEAIASWRKMPNGDLKVDTLVELSVTSITPHNVAVRLAYATSQKELDRYHEGQPPRHQVQISMSPQHAKELARMLVMYANALEGSVPPPGKAN